jgi:hypothetical protein
MRAAQFVVEATLTCVTGGASAALGISDTAMIAIEAGRYAYNESEYQRYGLKGSDTQNAFNTAYDSTMGLVCGYKGLTSATASWEAGKISTVDKYFAYAANGSNMLESGLTLTGTMSNNPDLYRVFGGVNLVVQGRDIVNNYVNYANRYSDNNKIGYANTFNSTVALPMVMAYNTGNYLMNVDYVVNGKDSWLANNYSTAKWVSLGANITRPGEELLRANVQRSDQDRYIDIKNATKGFDISLTGIGHYNDASIKDANMTEIYNVWSMNSVKKGFDSNQASYSYYDTAYKDSSMYSRYIGETRQVENYIEIYTGVLEGVQNSQNGKIKMSADDVNNLPPEYRFMFYQTKYNSQYNPVNGVNSGQYPSLK